MVKRLLFVYKLYESATIVNVVGIVAQIEADARKILYEWDGIGEYTEVSILFVGSGEPYKTDGIVFNT